MTIRKKEAENEKLRQKIVEIIEVHSAYGYRRLKEELKKTGTIINHKRLLPLLRLWGLSLRRKLVKRSQSGITALLQFLGSRVLAIKRLTEEQLKTLGRVVFCDFTEIVYNNGKNKLYLIPYLENKTKKIIGYAVGDRPTTELALQALGKAVDTLIGWGVDITYTYFHQDQGSAFTAYEYVRTIVKKSGAFISYSRVGKPQDNPEMEAFFGRFKDEWRQVFYEARNEAEILQLISEAIEYYNTIRIHSNHKNKSPDEFLAEIIKN